MVHVKILLVQHAFLQSRCERLRKRKINLIKNALDRGLDKNELINLGIPAKTVEGYVDKPHSVYKKLPFQLAEIKKVYETEQNALKYFDAIKKEIYTASFDAEDLEDLNDRQRARLQRIIRLPGYTQSRQERRKAGIKDGQYAKMINERNFYLRILHQKFKQEYRAITMRTGVSAFIQTRANKTREPIYTGESMEEVYESLIDVCQRLEHYKSL